MQIYHYHPTTKEYLGNSTADADPMNVGKYLIPAHATHQLKPMPPEGSVSVFANDAWSHMSDHRGQIYYDALGNEVTIAELGDVADELTKDKIEIVPTLEELQDKVRDARNAMMNKFQWILWRHVREERAVEPLTTLTETEFEEYITYMGALADITEQDIFATQPYDVVWPNKSDFIRGQNETN